MTAKPIDQTRNNCAPSAPLEIACPHHDAGAAQWFVLHTKPRQEKALVRLLEPLPVTTFLPLTRTVRHYGHRKRIVHLPLFPSYVFLRATAEQTCTALATGRVVSRLHAADQTTLAHEIEHLRTALAAGATLFAHRRLERGSRVRVVAGPLAGIEGLVEDRVRPERLILQVDMIGRAASLEIDADLLEPTD